MDSEMDSDEEFKKARAQALRYLSHRDLSEALLSERLTMKGFSEPAVQAVVNYLKEKNYLDDERYALHWGRGRIASKHVGARRLRQELLARKLAAGTVEKTLAVLFSEVDEAELARRCAEKKLPSLEGLENETRRRRLAGFLQRRGFDSGVVFDTVKEAVPSRPG